MQPGESPQAILKIGANGILKFALSVDSLAENNLSIMTLNVNGWQSTYRLSRIMSLGVSQIVSHMSMTLPDPQVLYGKCRFD